MSNNRRIEKVKFLIKTADTRLKETEHDTVTFNCYPWQNKTSNLPRKYFNTSLNTVL